MLKLARSLDGATPLPITQIAVLMVVRLAEPSKYRPFPMICGGHRPNNFPCDSFLHGDLPVHQPNGGGTASHR